jgi:hypothetical protein
MAAARARQWQDYADGTRAFEAQLARDTDRLRKVLPLGSVIDATKVDLLVRYAGAYGADRASAVIELLPAPAVRDRARLAVGCETKSASSCVALGRAADEANDAQGALGYFGRACDLDDARACAEAGERWLQPAARDASRAIVALQRGCALDATAYRPSPVGGQSPPPSGLGATPCARLARVYEEGDGTPANPALAIEMRDKACAAGDGNSCRRLACTVDTNASAGEQARANELWQRGCANGDAASCAVANATRDDGSPAVSQQVGAALTAGVANAAQAGSTTAQPASSESSVPAAASAGPSYLSAQARAAYDRQSRTGFLLLSVGAVAMGGAAFMAVQDGLPGNYHGSRFFGRHEDNTSFAVVLGALGLVSAGTGVAVLLSRPDPNGPQVGLGVGAGRLMLSGKLP